MHKTINNKEELNKDTNIKQSIFVNESFSIEDILDIIGEGYTVTRTPHIGNYTIGDIIILSEILSKGGYVQLYPFRNGKDITHMPLYINYNGRKYPLYEKDIIEKYNDISLPFIPKPKKLPEQRDQESKKDTQKILDKAISLSDFHLNFLKHILKKRCINFKEKNLMTEIEYSLKYKTEIEDILKTMIGQSLEEYKKTGENKIIKNIFPKYIKGGKVYSLSAMKGKKCIYQYNQSPKDTIIIDIENIVESFWDLHTKLGNIGVMKENRVGKKGKEEEKNNIESKFEQIEGVNVEGPMRLFFEIIINIKEQKNKGLKNFKTIYHIGGKDMGKYIKTTSFKENFSSLIDLFIKGNTQENIVKNKDLKELELHIFDTSSLRIFSLKKRILNYLFMLFEKSEEIKGVDKEKGIEIKNINKKLSPNEQNIKRKEILEHSIQKKKNIRKETDKINRKIAKYISEDAKEYLKMGKIHTGEGSVPSVYDIKEKKHIFLEKVPSITMDSFKQINSNLRNLYLSIEKLEKSILTKLEKINNVDINVLYNECIKLKNPSNQNNDAIYEKFSKKGITDKNIETVLIKHINKIFSIMRKVLKKNSNKTIDNTIKMNMLKYLIKNVYKKEIKKFITHRDDGNNQDFEKFYIKVGKKILGI